MSFLALLEDDDINRMTIQRGFRKGDVFLRQGDVADGLYVIQQGQCKLFSQIPGERGRIDVGKRAKGEVLAELSFIDGSPMMTSVLAVTDISLVFIPNETLIGLSLINPEKALRLVTPISELISARIRFSVNNLLDERLLLPCVCNAHLLQKLKLKKMSNKNRDEIIAHKNLQLLPLFDRIHKDNMAPLLSHFSFYNVKKNQILYESGNNDPAIYYVISGALQTYLHCFDEMTKLTVIGPGGFAGLMDFICHKERLTCCMVRENAIVLKLTKSDFETVAKYSPLEKDKLLLMIYKSITISFKKYYMHYLQTKSVYHLF